MADEVDEQKQIDRACAAQSPEMLPKPKVSSKAIAEAKARIEKVKKNRGI